MRPMPLIGLLLAVAACTRAPRAHQTAAPGPTPPPQPAVVFSAGTTHYRGVTHLRVEQKIEGQQGHASDFLLTYFATVGLAPDSQGRLRAFLVLDSILPTRASLLTETERDRARGAQLTGVLLADGRLEEIAGEDSLPSGRLRQFAAGLREFFPRIPAGGAAPEQSWTDTTELTTDAGGVALTIHSIDAHRIAGWSDYSGQRALEIRTSAAYTLSGSGQQSGQPFTLEGTGTRASTQFLSAGGRYLGRRSIDSSAVSVLLTGIGLVLPGLQIRADTLWAIP